MAGVRWKSHVKRTGVSVLLLSFFSFLLRAFCFPPETELVWGGEGRGGQGSRVRVLSFKQGKLRL